MKLFSVVVAVAGCVAAVSAQYSLNGHRLGTSYATKHVTYGTVGTPVVSRFGSSAGVVTAAGVANGAVVAQAPARPPKVHEIHTQSGRQHIRVEEFQAPNQVIRVHEAPQGAPEVLQVRAPARQSLVRVISHSAGPAHVERFVHEAPGVQVVDVHRPPPPAARIVQIVRGPAPDPQILFHQEDDGQGEIRVEAPPHPEPIVAPAVHAGPSVVATPVVRSIAAAPVVHSVAAAAPVFGTVSASVPVVRTVTSPGITSVRVPAVPVGVGYTMYGVGYGRLYSGHLKSRASRA